MSSSPSTPRRRRRGLFVRISFSLPDRVVRQIRARAADDPDLDLEGNVSHYARRVLARDLEARP